MLASREPRDAYRQSSFDARVRGCAQEDIVLYCLEELASTLGDLLQAELRNNRAHRSDAITRGIAILTALEMGVDRKAALSASLLDFYYGAKHLLLGSISRTSIEAVETLRADVIEIRDALAQAKRTEV